MRNLNLLFAFLITLNSFSQNAEVRFLKSCNKPNMPRWDKTMEGVSLSVYPAMPLNVGGIWGYGYCNKDHEMMRNGYESAISRSVAKDISDGL